MIKKYIKDIEQRTGISTSSFSTFCFVMLSIYSLFVMLPSGFNLCATGISFIPCLLFCVGVGAWVVFLIVDYLLFLLRNNE